MILFTIRKYFFPLQCQCRLPEDFFDGATKRGVYCEPHPLLQNWRWFCKKVSDCDYKPY